MAQPFVEADAATVSPGPTSGRGGTSKPPTAGASARNPMCQPPANFADNDPASESENNLFRQLNGAIVAHGECAGRKLSQPTFAAQKLELRCYARYLAITRWTNDTWGRGGPKDPPPMWATQPLQSVSFPVKGSNENVVAMQLLQTSAFCDKLQKPDMAVGIGVFSDNWVVTFAPD